MGFSPISAAQLWWRMAPADWPEVGTELGTTNWAAEAPTHKSHLFPSLQTPQTLFPGIKPTFWVSSLPPDNLLLLLQMENKKHFAVPDDDGQLDSSGAGW